MSMKIVIRRASDLVPYAANARVHKAAGIARLAKIMREVGVTNPIIVDDEGIVAGHKRREAILYAETQGWELRLPNGAALKPGMVPTINVGGWTETQRRAYIIADNQTTLESEWDGETLRLELDWLRGADDFDLDITGFDAAAIDALLDGPTGAATAPTGGGLSERFGVPPFSVLSARDGWWQDRKRAWLALGIQSELGRGDDAIGYSDACKAGYAKSYDGQDKLNSIMASKAKSVPAGLAFGKMESYDGANREMSGTSIFDPVLCELAYRWFCPPSGQIIDPFAGGSVRGIVAAKLGRQYWGGELRPEQVEANREQAAAICDDVVPEWHVGDSRYIDEAAAHVEADFLFSCPPYADLEVYSDNPADLSTLAYDDFREAYFKIIAASASRLRDNRFACFVIGEVRGKDGAYYGFVPDTIEAFRRAGLAYYNEAILVTAVGSLPIRTGRQFDAGRKVGKTHQNVLVFVKGDAKKATQAIGPVEFGEIEGIDAD